jgi:radical SAM-linked protein
MIGLPTETEEEVEEIVRMAQEIRRHGKKAREGPFQLTVNVSSFVPKAHTPLQWVRQQTMESSLEKQQFLRRKLKSPGFRLKWHDPRLSLLEGLFARGDRGLGDLIEAAYRLGCRRDGWSEHLRFDLWERAFEVTGVNPEDRLDPYPNPNDPLPWDWIDTGMPQQWFRDEYRRALDAERSDFACSGGCEECGLCLKSPEGGHGVHESVSSSLQGRSSPEPRRGVCLHGNGKHPAARFRLQYVKRRPAAYLSHLETLAVFYRALRRSRLPIHYTGGENPHPRVAFSQALPVGVESQAEYMDLWLSKTLDETEVEKTLNAVLPEGISVLRVGSVPLNASSLEQSIAWMEYEITFPEDRAAGPSQAELVQAMEAFYQGDRAAGGKAGEAGSRDEDLRRAVKLEGKKDGRGLVCRIHRLSGSTPSANRVVEALFPSPDRNGLRPYIVKTEAALVAPFPPPPGSKRKSRHAK